MRKSLFFAGLAAAALTLVGCNKEADFAGKTGRPFQVVLSTVDTRTVIDPDNTLKTLWAENDKINVFHAEAGTTDYKHDTPYVDNTAHPYIVSDTENGVFSGTLMGGDLEDGKSYDWYFYYPYNSYLKSPVNTSDARLYIGGRSDQPQNQEGYDSRLHLAGGASTGCFPLYGIVKNVPAATQPVAPMKHIASAIRINVTNGTSEGITIDEIEFTAPEEIVGNFFISFDKEPLTITPYASQAASTASLKVNNPTVLAAGATAAFYMGIKPFTAQAKDVLTIKVKVGDTVFEKSLALPSAVEFKSGSIKNLNVTYTGGAQIQGSTLEEIAAMATNSDVQTQEVLVVGKYARGIMLGQDGTFLLAFNSSGVTGAVGDIVTVSGKVGEYGGLKQITNPEVTVISSGNEVVLPEPKVLDGAAMDAYESTKIELIQYVGTLKVSGTYYNVEVSGATKKGSIQYPLNTEALTALKDKTVTATGFFTGITGSSTKYVSMMSTSVEEAAVALFGVESQEINVPATATSADIKVTGNVDWTVTPGDGILSAEPLSGTGAGTVKVTFAANTTAEPKEYSVTIGTTADVEDDEKFVTIIQAAASTEAKAYPYEETFETSQGDFMIVDEKLGEGLTYVWKHDASNKYMKASAYAGSNKESESWLVSPVVDLKDATSPALYFSQCISKYFGDVTKEATVWIKEEGGEWNQLTIEYPALSGNWSKMTDYTVDIKSYAGKKVQVGFKYTSSTSAAGTWEIKDFKLDEAVTGPVDPELTVSPSLTVEEGKTATISVTTNSDGEKTWSTSDATVATVSNGVVTGVKPGSATITLSIAATANFNTKSATIPVTVTEAGLQDFTWDLTQASYDKASASSVKWINDAATMETTQAAGANPCNNYLGGDKTSTRFYSKNSLVFTPATGVSIIKVEYTAMTEGYASTLANSTWTNATAVASGTEVVITPTDRTTAFSAVLGGTTGASSVKVYYTGTPVVVTLASINSFQP